MPSIHCLLKPLPSTTVGLILATLTASINTIPANAQLPPPVTLSQICGNGITVPSNAAYTLGAGDRVRIDILEVPDYSHEYQVLADGSLNLPLIGNLSVQGLSLKQAEARISNEYLSFLQLPCVTITLLAARPLKLGIAGEIHRPGSYTIPLEEGTSFPTVTQAIDLAGGVTQSADLRNVQIRRQTITGESQIVPVNLWALLQTGDLSQDVPLRDGDAIVIPAVENFDLSEGRQVAAASFSADRSQPVNIAVVGEVARPGPYTITSESQGVGAENAPITVTRAIELAGGIMPAADIRRIQVRRTTRTGVAQPPLEIDLWQLLKTGDLKQDAILQDGDTVIVPIATDINLQEAPQVAAASFSPDTIPVNVVGEVLRPGTVQVPPNTPLNQAILAAGGFNTRRARKSSVELIRLNPNGSVSRRRIPIDFKQGINEESNPLLHRNDVIVVGRSSLTSFSDTLGTALRPFGSVFSFLNFFRIFD